MEGGCSMDLETLFNEIEQYNKALGYGMTDYLQIDEIRHACLALYQEVAELTDSFPWKPWRPVKDQIFDPDNIQREVVDCIFFLVKICMFTGISWQQIESKFNVVLLNNYDRIDSGYNNTKEERR